MIHQYKLNGYNIVLDTCSGAIHVVDEVAYDVIGMFGQESEEKIIETLLERYKERPDVTEEDLRLCQDRGDCYAKPGPCIGKMPGRKGLRRLSAADAFLSGAASIQTEQGAQRSGAPGRAG